MRSPHARKPLMPTVLVGVEDPGAANALAPVVAALKREDVVRVVCLCHARVEPAFRTFGIQPECIATPDAVARRLAQASPALVLIGTAESLRAVDRVCFREARKHGIPTVSLLDHWANYAERFSGPTPRERLAYLPDLVFVMDEVSRQALVHEGVPAERLVVSGQPYLDGYAERVGRLSPEVREQVRAQLGIEPGQKLVTFVSETFGWSYDSSYRFPPLSASRERTVIILEHVLAALSRLVHAKGLRLALVNKLHPKNRLEEFLWLDERQLPFPVRLVHQTDNASLLQVSSVVVGMTSMLLIEAACLGIPTLSVVPRAIEERIGPNGEQAWGIARTPAELFDAFGRLLGPSPPTPSVKLSEPHRGATQRVVRTLYELLGVPSAAGRGPAGRLRMSTATR